MNEQEQEKTVHVECDSCPWRPGEATAIPRVVLQVAVNDMMHVATAHAWENEGHVTRVLVDGRWHSRHVKTKRREE